MCCLFIFRIYTVLGWRCNMVVFIQSILFPSSEACDASLFCHNVMSYPNIQCSSSSTSVNLPHWYDIQEIHWDLSNVSMFVCLFLSFFLFFLALPKNFLRIFSFKNSSKKYCTVNMERKIQKLLIKYKSLFAPDQKQINSFIILHPSFMDSQKFKSQTCH